MSFCSIDFLFYFLPAFLLIFYITPARFRTVPLLLGSLVFYYLSVTNVWALLLPVVWLLMAYCFGLYSEKCSSVPRIALFICLFVNFGILLAFKYAGLFTDKSFIIPAGISFYTFQLTGYMIGIARSRTKAEHNLLKFSAGMLMFPKLLSGPITLWENIEPQLGAKKLTFANFDDGLRDLILGLGLKTLLADRIGGLWSQVKQVGFENISTPLAWLGILAYSLQLYFDFYSYSLMAIGTGKMLGFRLPDNFAHPYASKSMTEFWRRWHISLGAWFRENLYIPMGGNRNHLYFNLLIVWLCTGIWHGSTANFILWGLFLFCIIAFEKFSGIAKSKSPFLHLYMIPLILISWTFFAITDIGQLGVFFARLFPFFGEFTPILPDDWLFHGKKYFLLLAIGIIFSLPFPARLWKKIRSSNLGTIILFIIFWAAVYCLSAGLNDPFMYFSF